MKKFLLTLSSASLILLPSVAMAAFDSPGKLITSIQEQSGTSFQMTVHTMTQGTYTSVWATGTSQRMKEGKSADMRTNATIDVVQNGMKIRAKGEAIVQNETLYVKLNSLTGNYASALGSFAMNGYQKKWLSLPMDGEIPSLFGQDIALDLQSINAENADSMYLLQHTVSNGVNVYTLRLAPDYAPELALKIRGMLGDTEAVSTDFFPWRELAEGIRYELVIRTDMKDRFLSSSLSLGTATLSSSYSATINEKASASATPIATPKDAVDMQELMEMVLPGMGGDFGTLPIMEDMSEPMLAPSGATFDSVEGENVTSVDTKEVIEGVDPACTDQNLTALMLVSLQRSGTCPTDKISTRFRR